MKTRNGLIVTVVAVVSLSLASTSSWAGSKQQHRWEGVAIGIGAVMVGSALINHHAYGYHGGPPIALSFNYRDGHRYPARRHGHYKRHHNHWRPHARGPRYSGNYRHG